MKVCSLVLIYYRQIRKRLIREILLIVLFVIAIVMIHLAIYESVKSRYDIYTVESFFPDRKNLYNIDILTLDLGETTEKGISQFVTNLGGIEGVEMCGKFYFVNRELMELREDKNFLEYNSTVVAGTERDGFPSLINFGYIDRSMADLLGVSELVKAKKGNWTPVFVGVKYKQFFQEGDIYTDDTGCRYRICGVLPEGFRFPPDALFTTILPYSDMDDVFLALYDNMSDPQHLYMLNAANSIYCKTDGSMETEERIKQFAKQNFIHIRLATIDERIEQRKEEQKEILGITALFTGISVIAAFLAMISSSVIQIILRKQEYGILFANGMSHLDVVKLIGLENEIRQGIAFIIATFIALRKIKGYVVFDTMDIIEIFKGRVIGLTALLVFLLFILSTYIPARIFSRLQTTELMRGSEA